LAVASVSLLLSDAFYLSFFAAQLSSTTAAAVAAATFADCEHIIGEQERERKRAYKRHSK
jgi:hypothetical protein